MIQRIRSSIRLLFLGAWYSYRGVFSWQSPSFYVLFKIVNPLFVTLLFVYLGKYAGFNDPLFIVVGNIMLIPVFNGVSCVSKTIGNERSFRTLPHLFITPASRLIILVSHSLIHILDSIALVLIIFPITFLLGLDPALINFPALLVCILLLSLTSTTIGLVLGSFALISTEGQNITATIPLLFYIVCGVNIPLASLPAALQGLAYFLPLTRGIEAARMALDGAAFSQIAGLVGGEVLVGVIYAAVGYFIFLGVEHYCFKTGFSEAI